MGDPGSRVTVVPRELLWVKPLGSGSFGQVSLGKYQSSYRAVKILAGTDKGVEWQLDVLNSLTWRDHIVVPTEHGISSSGDKMFLASYGENYDLAALLERGSSLPRLVQIAKEVAAGMTYLHGKKPIIAHLDLKPSNVVLSREYRAMIADLGMAAVLSENQMPATPGTLLYAAPELFRGGMPLGNATGQPQEYLLTKADVFSFGIMLYEMMLSLHKVDLLAAYDNTADELNVRNLRPTSDTFYFGRRNHPDARPSWQLPETAIPAEITTLIHSCWATDPLERPTFKEILEKLEHAQKDLGLPNPEPPMRARDLSIPPMALRVPPQLPLEALQQINHAPAQQQPADDVQRPGSTPTVESPFAGVALHISLHTNYSSCSGNESAALRTAFPRNNSTARYSAAEVKGKVDRELGRTKVGRWLKQAVAQMPADRMYSNDELRQLGVAMKDAVAAAHAEGFEMMDNTRSSLSDRERRAVILDMLPLTWTATDWLIGTWGALVLRNQGVVPSPQPATTGTGAAPEVKMVCRKSLLDELQSAEELQTLASDDAADIRKVLLGTKEELVALHELLEGLHDMVRAQEEPVNRGLPYIEHTLVLQQQAKHAELSAKWHDMYIQKQLTEKMDYLKKLKRELKDRYPDALFLPPTVEPDTKEKVFNIMRDTWGIWEEISDMHRDGVIDDQWFRKYDRWFWRGKELRELVEPVDIANWYMKNKQDDYKEMYNCVEEGYHYAAGIDDEMAEMTVNNGRRPVHFTLLQRIERQVFGLRPQSTVAIARRFARMFGNRRWEDCVGGQPGGPQRGGAGDTVPVADQ